LYDARDAQKEYELIRSESRSGISISELEVLHLDRLISPLIQKGQSIHHIYANNRDQFMCSEKTIYNYVDYNLFSARNVDLPRKVRYHLRKKNTNYFKVDKTCRIGRSYNDFLAFTLEHPDIPVVEMDSVMGTIGGKVLLTLHFVQPQLMLAYLRDANDSKSVIDIFDKLYLELQPDLFMQLFPLLLCDNGSEFTNPKAIEYDRQNNKRTSVFYCNPLAPYQKGAAENNHEFIRRILPKGSSFDHLSQEDIDLMMYHINSYGRNKLGDKSPYQAFEFLYGESALKKIGYKIIAPNDIILQPSLLKNKH
jgi:IS30 family transposase